MTFSQLTFGIAMLILNTLMVAYNVLHGNAGTAALGGFAIGFVTHAILVYHRS